MLQHFGINDEILQVSLIQLRKHRVKKLSSLLTATGDKGGIVRSDNHAGVAAYMLWKFIIRLIIYQEFLFACFPQNANRLFWFFLQFKISFDSKAASALLHTTGICPGEVAFGKAEVVNSIQQVGFANAIIATNAHYPVAEIKCLVRVVFKLKQRYGMKLKH